MKIDFEYIVVCEDDTVVACVDSTKDVVMDWVQPNLSVRIDLADGDGEFVTVKELADMYRGMMKDMAK